MIEVWILCIVINEGNVLWVYKVNGKKVFILCELDFYRGESVPDVCVYAVRYCYGPMKS